MNLTKETTFTLYTKSDAIHTILYYKSIFCFFFYKWPRDIIGQECVKIQLYTFPPDDDN